MIIADDIMVIGYQEDEWDHDKAFTQLLETAKKNNIKLNFDTIQYKQKEVEFFGETYTTQGCKPSDTKGQGNNRDAQARKSERSTDLPRHDTIFKQVFT